VQSDFDPEAPTFDDRARAATSSGVIAFVGLTIGGIGIPGVIGVVASAVGGLLPQEALFIAAVIGGSLGAGAGGFIGAIPTVRWYGIPVVGVAAAVGSLLGLVPTAMLAFATKDDPPNGFDTFHPLVLAQSGALVLSMVGAAGGGAAAGAIFADKWEPTEQ
jgi:hypothetical protein